MTMTKNPASDTQAGKFRDLAREPESDEDEAFKARFGKIARAPKPEPTTPE